MNKVHRVHGGFVVSQDTSVLLKSDPAYRTLIEAEEEIARARDTLIDGRPLPLARTAAKELCNETVSVRIGDFLNVDHFNDNQRGQRLVGIIVGKSHFFEENATDTCVTIHVWDNDRVFQVVFWRDSVPTFGHLLTVGNKIVVYCPRAIPYRHATTLRQAFQMDIEMGVTHVEALMPLNERAGDATARVGGNGIGAYNEARANRRAIDRIVSDYGAGWPTIAEMIPSYVMTDIKDIQGLNRGQTISKKNIYLFSCL